MTEKDARFWLTFYRAIANTREKQGDVWPLIVDKDAIDATLAQEPDTVKTLRYLSRSKTKGFAQVRRWIEREFGVCLTDDGYEYLESEES